MFCISISHKKAPAQIREQYSFTKEQRTELKEILKQKEQVDGSVILCTCNRCEIYFSKKSGMESEQRILDCIIQVFAEFRGVSSVEFSQYLNLYANETAVRHLFQVCAGLESKILGEDEILRQVKEALEESMEECMLNYELNVLFQKAITCAKKIKTDTSISNVPISITTLVANEVYHWKQEGKKVVLLLGITGKMGSIIAKNIMAKEKVELIAAVRSQHGPLGVPEIKGDINYIPFERRYDYVDQADIIISVTASPHIILTQRQLGDAITTKKQRLLIDLAIPRDIDPALEQCTEITLHNIDYFDNISELNGVHKLEELEYAKMIMQEEIEGALKELLFHNCYQKIPEWKAIFQEKSFEKILYSMKKNLDYESMKKVLYALNHVNEWID